MPVTSPRASASQRNTPPPLSWSNVDEWVRMVAESVRLLFDGRVNTVGQVTLRTSQVTTSITDPRISPDSFVQLSPMNANAGGELGIYVVPGNGSAVINHASNGTTRTFKYVILG